MLCAAGYFQSGASLGRREKRKLSESMRGGVIIFYDRVAAFKVPGRVENRVLLLVLLMVY